MTTTKTMKKLSTRAVALAVALAATGAFAADPAVSSQPVGVVGLQASATAEVTKDLLSVALTTTREGTEAAQVQAQLKQALDAALAEAKKAAKPGQIDVQTGNFSLFPRYTNKGVINGWQGTAELLIEGRDIPGIAKLTGRITTLTIGRVGTNLSREQREKVESSLAAQAIASYRAKATEISKQFGYTGYVIREVNVGSNEPVGYAAAPMMRKSAMSADEALPVELGKGTVTVTVNGTVQMTK
ncbi:MAG: SIMPL domain-containing protein [Rhizobacter sp.]